MDVEYNCKTPIGDKSAVSPIDIKGAQSGSGYKITMSWQKGVSSSPVELGKGSMNPSATIKLGGAESGTLTVTGPPNAEAIPANTPIEIPDLKGTYKPGATGESTLSPGVLTVEALGTTTCTPSKSEVSLTLDTTEQPGGASGGGSAGGSAGSSASGSGSGGTSGGLADTGADDHSTLKALGLVAGTVTLLGGAVFTFLPRRRLR